MPSLPVSDSNRNELFATLSKLRYIVNESVKPDIFHLTEIIEATMSDQTPEQDRDFGQRLTSLVVGIDRLERRVNRGAGPLDDEGLIPIYLGGDLVPKMPLESWETVFTHLDDLEREASTYSPGPRRTYLLAMTDSLRAAAQLFTGIELSFAEKLERLVGVPAAPVAPEQLKAMRTNLSALLEASGYRQGSLAERVTRWEGERFLKSDKIEPTFEALMLEAQRRTDAMIFPTGDYQMRLNLVRGVPYTARCNFDQGLMDLNADLEFTPSALKHLVAHEVFPGHSTQLLYTLERAKSGEGTPDVLLCTANTVVGAIQEGIGDQGIHLIDWVTSEDDAIFMALRRLRSAAATSAAWYQMGEGWSLVRVRTFLQETAFPQPAWLEGRLRFAAHPFRGPFIASYWYGDEAVREVRERAASGQRSEFIKYLYGQMHSLSSLKMFGLGMFGV